MNENLEKYFNDLSPELQEKARQCKTKEELDAFIAENDIELPEEALELVSGGACVTQGKESTRLKCPLCNSYLHFYDTCYSEKGLLELNRYYCANESCSSFNNGLWYQDSNGIIKKY